MDKKYFGRNKFLDLPINRKTMFYLKRSLDVYTFDSYVSLTNDKAHLLMDKLERLYNENPAEDRYVNEKGVCLPITTDLNSLKTQILIISEVQIMFTYKQFEASLKNLLKTLYPEELNNNLYKWNSIIKTFKSKGYDIKQLEGYKDVNQLRVVNNAIKHNLEAFGESTKSIPELSVYSEEGITGKQLSRFYDRVKDAVPVFYSEICCLVEKDVFGSIEAFEENNDDSWNEEIDGELPF